MANIKIGDIIEIALLRSLIRSKGREVLGLGPDKRSVPVRIISSMIAAEVACRAYAHLEGSTQSTFQSTNQYYKQQTSCTERKNLKDYPYYAKIDFIDGSCSEKGSVESFSFKDFFKEQTRTWLQSKEEAIKELSKKINKIDKKIQFYSLSNEEIERKKSNIRRLEYKVREIEEMIEKTIKNGPEIY